jgi:hypothetical protein
MVWFDRRLKEGNSLQSIYDTPPDLGELFRTDAKAEGGRATIGGWELGPDKCTRTARWFFLEVLEADFPWAFSKRDPQRFIAALELLGSILAIILFSPAWPRRAVGRFSVTGSTDNKGMSHAVAKMLSTKFPVAILLLELCEWLRAGSLELSLSWLQRDLNKEADAITNEDFTGFDQNLRLEVVPSKIPWKVLTELMNSSQELYQQIGVQRELNKVRKAEKACKGQRRRKRLRASDPW